MKKLLFLLTVVLLLVISGCGTAGYKNVSTEQSKELIDNQEVVVLDVRTPEEFQTGHIQNALLIPVQELEARLSELDKDDTYLVVCRSGNRSAQASEILISNGFTEIYNMTGGMNNWSYDVEL